MPRLGLTSDELAFYDAICTNASAVMELSDDTLKKIAHELVDIVRRDAKTDWNVKEQVRAKLRATIKRLLLKYGYPPDQEPAATQLVLEQAEVIAAERRPNEASPANHDGHRQARSQRSPFCWAGPRSMPDFRKRTS